MAVAREKILLIQLEFPTWAAARAWTYSASYAVQEGLVANGAQCTLLPVIAQIPTSSPRAWLYHARQWLAGRQFDQVWVWLVHTPLDAADLQWLTTLAPIRVGVLMESLQYDEEDYRHVPHLRGRQEAVERQLRYMTHVLAPDEVDVEWAKAHGLARVLWWPPMVPDRLVASSPERPTQRRAVFHGTPYGARQPWLSHPELRDLMAFVPSAAPTQYHLLFDRLQQAADQFLSSDQPVTESKLNEYGEALRGIRAAEFAEWTAGLRQWPAIVNLPSLAKFYGGRVLEAMAVGRPVVSWEIPRRPRNLALFTPGTEIVLFDKDDPRTLARELARLREDEGFARAVALQSQEKIRRYHTAERRLGDTLAWIRSGCEPDYGLGQGHASHSDTRKGQMNRDASSITRSHATDTSTPPAHHTDAFYEQLFVKTPHWSTPQPNGDEAARWSKIASFLELILRGRPAELGPLRVVEVGCGRGWLTNLVATYYGTCEGVEPVGAVVERARQLFPSLRFTVGTADTLLARDDFAPYDVVISSEVLEHVPHAEQTAFIRSLRALLKPGGTVILSTPRGDVWEQWQRIAPPNQPIEDWLTEQQLQRLCEAEGLECVALERVHVMVPSLRFMPAPTPEEQRTLTMLPIYQVWAFRRPTDETARTRLRSHRPPLVSVILPTYNRPERLRDALESVLAQTMQDFEIIVVNDGEVDVAAVIRSLDHGGRIVFVVHDRNRGLAAARNTGLRLARGRYIAYLDDDDRYYPDHLETLTRALEDGSYKVAYTDACRVHETIEGAQRRVIGRDVPYSYDFNAARLLVSNYFPVLCVMHERSVLEQAGVFDETLFAHEDWDLWIRMAMAHAFLHVKRTTAEFTWRTDGSSMTSATGDTYLRTTEIIYRKYRPHAERIPGVLEAQQEQLTIRRRALARKAFTCSIVIPVWNRAELTLQCLTALAEATAGLEYEVIIVDNASTDETARVLATLSGDVRVIRNDANLGFAKACNQGAQAARGRYIVFLNNDTIPLAGWLAALVEEVEAHPDVAVVGSKLLYADGTVQHAGVVFSRKTSSPYHVYAKFPAQTDIVNRRREFQAVTAACLLVRRDVFEAVGGFDEGYRNGFEDVDLCLKIRELGGRIVYQPKSVLYHLESQTPGRKSHDEENVRRLHERWADHWWLPDEDLVYVGDGLIHRATMQDGGVLEPLPEGLEASRWMHVAEVQRAGQQRDVDRVRSLLSRPDEWPDDAGVLQWAARLCQRLDVSAYAEPFWRRLLNQIEDCEARLVLARVALTHGAIAEADVHIRALLAGAPDNPEAWLLAGVAAMQREAYADATHAFKTALAQGGDPRKASMGLGMAAMGQGNAGAAWEAFDGVLALNPDDQEAVHWLIRVGAAREDWRGLAERLQRFTMRNPGDLAARFALAGVWIRLAKKEMARQEYDAIRLLHPAHEGLEDLAKALNQEACAASLQR